MQPVDWFTINKNLLGASRFYLRSPYHQSYFLAASFILFADLVLCGLILVRYWATFGFLAFLWLGSGMSVLTALWFLALRTHERVNLLFTTGQIEKLEIGSPLDVALGVAAQITNVGLCLASMAVAGCLMTLGLVLVGR